VCRDSGLGTGTCLMHCGICSARGVVPQKGAQRNLFCWSGDLAFRVGPLVPAIVSCAKGTDREYRFPQAIGTGRSKAITGHLSGEDNKAVALFAASDTK
jgi:hypothetical protein